MTEYLVDTHVISETARPKPDPPVLCSVRRILAHVGDKAIADARQGFDDRRIIGTRRERLA